MRWLRFPGTGRARAMAVGSTAAALIGVAAVTGIAGAQTPPPPERPRVQQAYDRFVSALAARLGKDEASVKAAIVDAQKDLVQQAVTEGKLTREQADKLIERIDEKGIGALGIGQLGRPKGPPAHAGPKAGHPPRARAKGIAQAATVKSHVDAAAQFLGVTERDLVADLRNGKSLAQIATEKGKSRDDLKAAILAETRAGVDRAVAAGRLTADQGQKLVQAVEQRLDRIVDATHSPRGPKPGRGAGA